MSFTSYLQALLQDESAEFEELANVDHDRFIAELCGLNIQTKARTKDQDVMQDDFLFITLFKHDLLSNKETLNDQGEFDDITQTYENLDEAMLDQLVDNGFELIRISLSNKLQHIDKDSQAAHYLLSLVVRMLLKLSEKGWVVDSATKEGVVLETNGEVLSTHSKAYIEAHKDEFIAHYISWVPNMLSVVGLE